MIGTALRAGLSLFVPSSTFPLAIFIANILGAFALGFLLESLAASDRPRLRLFLGTGLLGGFTTYSALATDTALLTGSWIGIAYPLLTIIAGFGAALAGIRLAGRTA